MEFLPSILRLEGTAHWCYCAGVLPNMDTQLLSFSLMGILQPRYSKISGVRRDRFIMTSPKIQGAQSKDHRPKKLWGKTMGEFGIFCDLDKLSKKLPKLWSEFNQKTNVRDCRNRKCLTVYLGNAGAGASCCQFTFQTLHATQDGWHLELAAAIAGRECNI